MKGSLLIYAYDGETRVEISKPDTRDDLTIMIESIDPGGKYCGADIEAEAIPEIIDYLQRAWTEYGRTRKPRADNGEATESGA